MANDKTKLVVAKKMDETSFFVETMTNKHNDERQIQINDTYFPKGSEELAYARRGVNINVIDIPDVVAAISKLYEEETGKGIDYET